jgi:branched-chain amino acid transport system substrate-binding protein
MPSAGIHYPQTLFLRSSTIHHGRKLYLRAHNGFGRSDELCTGRDIMAMKRTIVTGLLAAGFVLIGGLVFAAGQYGPGVSDTEIKLGNTMPYSGPASAYGVIGRSEAAYFVMINDQGGINSRKINFISRDDGYSPPKTVEVVRQLVEEEHVFLLFNPLGTPPNTAIQGYLNDNKVPQLFVATGADKWNDPKHHPWTMGWGPSYQIEARIYGRYLLQNLPDAKIAVLYQNDDFGKDYVIGLREGLGDKADSMIVATTTYETTDATVDSQIVALQGSGANVLLTAAIPKFAAQAIRKVYNIGWKPTHILSNVSSSVGAVMQPAGPEKGVGIISAAFLKDPTDPQWQNTPEYKDWLAWMKKYNTSANIADAFSVFGYSAAQTMVAVLKASGDNLTRENVMTQAASLHTLALPMLLPGITLSTSADDFAPIKQMQLQKFDGTTWKLFGEVISGSGS